MAVAVMTAGAFALMSLHQVTTRANLQARELGTAQHAASIWVERLQRDAMLWNDGGPNVGRNPGALALALARTTYLRNTPAPGTTPRWFVPTPPIGAAESWAFDHWGRDTRTAAEMRYCTNVRLQWVYPGSSIRADVRVWWPRRHPAAVTGDLQGCNPGLPLETLDARRRDAHFVYASTVLRWTPLRSAP